MQTMTTVKSTSTMPKIIDRHHTMRKLMKTCNTTDKFLRSNNDLNIFKDKNIMNNTFHINQTNKSLTKFKIIKLKDCISADTGIHNVPK